MMATEHDEMVFTELVSNIDIEIPCFYHAFSQCGPAPARWVMHARCPHCGHTVQRLVCGPDKNLLTSTEAGLLCEVCLQHTAPARHLYYLIEWLK